MRQVKHKLEVTKRELGTKLEQSKVSPPPQTDHERCKFAESVKKIEEKLYG